MKKKSTRAKKVPVSAEPDVAITLKLGDLLLQGTGGSILEALRSLPVPVKIVTKSVLTVTKGDKTHSRPLTIPLAKRLFYPAHQIFHARNLELLLK